jgi:hypothetical protein
MSWTHIYIDENMPGERYGTGDIGLADFDGDGRLDVATTRRSPKAAYWYRQECDGSWTRHVIGTSPHLEYCLGAVAMDVDGDGLADYVCNKVWFKNPGCLAENPDAPWQAFDYPGTGHDILSADMNGDGRPDIVAYDGHTLAWYDCADNLREHIVCSGRDDHGGVAPHGVGDISGNGYPDIVLIGQWYENPGPKGGPWKVHEWPHLGVDRASYGPSMRCWLADMDGNGEPDIVYTDCDTGWSHAYIVKNLGKGKAWERVRLPDPPGNPETGSFHSLIVADFDGDGRLEIFTGEQEDPDRQWMLERGLRPMKPEGLLERGILYCLRDGMYVPRVIHEGRPGWHDAVAGDVRGTGRLDIVTKVWNADGPNYHVDLWRNEP